MGNISVSIDDKTIKEVERIAHERETTLTAMLREYMHHVTGAASAASNLPQVTRAASATRHQQAEELRKSFTDLSTDIGGVDWDRDDLYR